MENVLFTRQRHEAEKAGLHWDYRIVVGDKALSWATKKELPEEGKSIMLWEQPVHTASYALSPKVVIPTGQYGAGVTTLDWVKKGQADIEDGQITVHTNEGRYLLKHMPGYQNGTGWLFKKLPTKELEKKAMTNKYIEALISTGKGGLRGAIGGAVGGGATGALNNGLNMVALIQHNLKSQNLGHSYKDVFEVLKKHESVAKEMKDYVKSGAKSGAVSGATIGTATGSLQGYLNHGVKEKEAKKSLLKYLGVGAAAGAIGGIANGK